MSGPPTPTLRLPQRVWSRAQEEAEDAMVLEVEGRFNMMLVWFNKKIKKQKLKNLQQKPSMRR